MDLFEPRPVIFTAQSRHLFYCRMLICRYVFEQGGVPVNPFNVSGYFLYELVDRDLVRRGNNNLIRLADELWSFGPIADGVLIELDYAMSLGKPIRLFSAGSEYDEIRPVGVAELSFEDDALGGKDEGEVRARLARYVADK